MRVALGLATCPLLAPTVALSQSDSQKPSTACTPQLDSIGESLRHIEASLSRVSQQMQLQSQVGAIAALDTDISTLSAELQRSLEGRVALTAAVARYRAMAASGQQLLPGDLSDQAAHQEALDQLERRIEEIRQTLSVRKSQLTAVEKALGELTQERK